MSEAITVVKLDHKRQEVWRYEGHVIHQNPGTILLEAVFNKPDLKLRYAMIRTGDIFRELYFSDHRYNIYQILDKQNRQLKYWYCNVAMPAQFTANQVIYVNLVLDLLVFPDGRSLELDWDEFNHLDLPRATRQHAIAGLNEVNQIVIKGDLPELFPEIE